MSTGETEDAARVIEGVLMVAIEPVPVELLAQLLETPVAGVEAIVAELKAGYDEQGRGFELVKVAGGYRFQSHPDVSHYVERFVLDGQRARLSAAALETLAIVAYKQPISRLQIASIRGVDPDAVLRTLLGRGYIEQRGRDDGPGQAVLWGTTPLFLEKLGINSVDELPPLAEFVPDVEIVEALEATLRITPIEAEAGGAGGDAPTSDD
jgi:segregation and condensation protein B